MKDEPGLDDVSSFMDKKDVEGGLSQTTDNILEMDSAMADGYIILSREAAGIVVDTRQLLCITSCVVAIVIKCDFKDQKSFRTLKYVSRPTHRNHAIVVTEWQNI